MKKFAYMAAASFALLLTSCGTSIPTSPAEELASGDKPDFAQARILAAKDRDNAQYADKAHAWFASGNIEHKLFESEYTKMVLPTVKADTAKMFDALLNELPYFKKALALDSIPNAKGKVELRFTPKVKEILSYDHKFLLNAGYFYLQKENYDKSLKAFSNYLQIREMPLFNDVPEMKVVDSALMDARYYAIAAAYQIKDYKKVIADATKYKSMKYNQNNIYQMLASSYVSSGDTTKYLEVLKEGAELFNDSYYLGNIVNVYSLQNKLDDAITFLKKAIEKTPKNALFLNAMGSLFERKDDYKTAGEWYEKILAFDADNFDANYNLARSYYNQAVVLLSQPTLTKLDKDKAMDLYRKSLPYFEKAYSKDKKKVYYVLSSVYNALGMEKEYNEVMDANK